MSRQVHDNPVDRACAALYAAGLDDLAADLQTWAECVARAAGEVAAGERWPPQPTGGW